MSENLDQTRSSAGAGWIIALIGAAWFASATIAVTSGWLASLRPPMPQVVLASVTAALIAAYWLISPLRRWCAEIDLRWLIGLHLVRFVGIYFLVLQSWGRLPAAFATQAGIWDVCVAVGAALILAFWNRAARNRPRWWNILRAWNIFGSIDIMLVVANAARQAMRDAASMHELLVLPLGLLPTFIVPLIIATHLLLFVRLAKPPPPAPNQTA